MTSYTIHLQLLSDSTFGRGDGIAGMIDQEVEHDQFGFPFLRGRTLKGLLREECDNLVYLFPNPLWTEISGYLFGTPGSKIESRGAMYIGDAQLPEDLRQAIAAQLQRSRKLTDQDILNSLTTLRYQTAIDAKSGTASDNSLRTSRVILRELEFHSILDLHQVLATKLEDSLALLAAGAQALRHLGSVRNRGRGHVRCRIKENGQDITQKYCDRFCNAIQQKVTA
jgi:CRISPR/Cas system CSM-associated protein Csm3 (group 7 of RAMP superfamily)